MATFDDIAPDLERQAIELPSWAFGNSGTRFKVFPQPGVPRDPYEKIADAAQVHQCTGLAPTVALHIPWDRVDDFDKLRRHADDLGVRLGTINTNTFQDDDYKFGSLCHVDDVVRTKAIAHMHDCVDIMGVTGSRDLKIWLPDGLNYPGQGDFRDRQERLADSLRQVYARISAPPAVGARIQVLRARVLRDRRARLGHCVCALRRARRARRRLPRHRPPRAGYQHRVHRHAAAAARTPGVVRLQLALLRGRRSDRRGRRPVPALPHPVRGRARWWLRPRQRRRIHARPVPQRRGEDPRSDPLGVERARDDARALLVDRVALAEAERARATCWAGMR